MNDSERRVERRPGAGAGAAVLLALLAAANCSDDLAGPAEKVAFAVIASNAVATPAGAGQTTGQTIGIVYVSAAPGTVAGGETVRITNASTGSMITAAILDGGFDPVRIEAEVGHTLIVAVFSSSGEISRIEIIVHHKRPPRIVRTSPAAKKRDVPLNAAILVVFSEPIDAGTVTSNHIRLLHDGLPVGGTLSLAPDGLTAAFRPASLLEGETDYTLQVTTGVKDLEGETLPAGVLVTFRTSASALTPGITIMPNPIRALAMTGGGHMNVRVTLIDAAGHDVSNTPVLLQTSDESMISFGAGVRTTQDGQAWAHLGDRPGSATITASHNGMSASTTVLLEERVLEDVSVGVNGQICFLASGGTVYCRGSNDYGELGLGFVDGEWGTGASNPLAVPNVAFETISTAWNHSCGLDAGGVAYCWGRNENGELGDRSYTMRTSPVRVAQDGVTFQQIGTGHTHSCALAQDGSAYCWGAYGWARIDSITTDPAARLGPSPVQIPGGIAFTAISTGGIITCGLDGNGMAWCWGMGGGGSPGTTLSPVAVAGDHRFVAISTDYRTCGLTAAGEAYCWVIGYDPEPIRIDLPAGIALVDIAAGDMLSCGLTAAGAAYCWGWTWPCSSCEEVSIPPQRVGQSTFRAIDTGNQGVCGVTTAGAFECWTPSSLVGGQVSAAASATDAYPPRRPPSALPTVSPRVPERVSAWRPQ